jgi:Uma2 family endonuclease
MTAIAPQRPATEWSGWAEHIVLEGITWETYERLRDETDASGRIFYMTYDEGTLEIMGPSLPHEFGKKVIAVFIEDLVIELGWRFYPAGGVTIRRKRIRKGLEPDECYYIRSEPLVRDDEKVDKQHIPAPDLVVEMEVTRRSIARRPIYARMGVPELWIYDGLSLQFLHLESTGGYEPSESSISFPFLKLADLEQFVLLARKEGQTAARRAFRDWVKQFADQKPPAP